MTFLLTYYGPGPLFIIGLVLRHRQGDQWLVALTAVFSSGRAPLDPAPSTAAPGIQSLWTRQHFL